ncbi:MAG: hypothetical protein R3348_02310 [Xanthomonadales bacterium]|nr:hypothetical protein [Xanthomonadales bacterium]
MSFFDELKRRNVFRVAVAYIVAAWVVLQVADLVMDAINAPDWVLQAMLFFVVLGFFAAVIVAWAYEITPEGIKRESEVDRSASITHHTAAKLDRITIGLLVLVVAIILIERFVVGPAATPAEPATVQQAETTPEPSQPPAQQAAMPNSVAVLPFVAMSSGKDDEYFADGLTEEILNSLAQLPELLITARTSSFSFKGQDIPVTEIADALGVAHIVEGSVRRSGERLRVTAQLVRAADGFHLWSENYDSTSQDTIQVQEDIAEKIAVAMDVVMNDEKREAMRRAGLRNVDAFILMQKADRMYESAHGSGNQDELLRQANELYDEVLALVPDHAKAHYRKSDRYIHLLSDDASGFYPERHSAEELKAAHDKAVQHVSRAAELARNFSEENNYSIDLAYLQGQMAGIGSRIDRFFDTDDCDDPGWLPALALAYGYAKALADRYREVRVCDPMFSTAWLNEVRALLWSDQPGEALRTAREGMEVAPSTWLSYYLVFTLMANRQFEEARDAVIRHMDLREDVLAFNGLIHAAQGEKALALELFEQSEDALTGEKGTNEFWRMMAHARVGNLGEANEYAAFIDQHVFGPQTLLLSVMWCNCGAPFDLEATPNFAAMIEAAGHPWPPASPIEWPLKNW